MYTGPERAVEISFSTRRSCAAVIFSSAFGAT
jgi:hypothetical protein